MSQATAFPLPLAAVTIDGVTTFRFVKSNIAMSMRYHPYARSPASVSMGGEGGPPGGAPIVHVPEKVAPFERVFTDVVERTVDIFPNPNSTINSSNSGQIVRFDMPTNNFLDMTSTGKPLELELNLKTGQAGDIPGNLLGHLIQNIRVFINNEQTQETLNEGQLNSMYQNTVSDQSRRNGVAWALAGGLPDPMAPTSLNSDATFLNNNALGHTAGALATARPVSIVSADGTTTINNSAAVMADLRYNIPSPPGMTTATRAAVVNVSGMVYKIPLDIPGGLLGMKKGLIPLFLIPRMRIEVTFNPALYVLFGIKNPTNASGGANNTAIGDYALTNLRITLNCIQSASLQRLYKQGMKWSTSFLGFNYFSTALSGAVAAQTVSISAPFRSLRALVGYIVNPAQFTAALPQDRSLPASLVAVAGNATSCTTAPGDAVADNTRWDNFYGLGGCAGGANSTISTGLQVTAPPAYRGQDSQYIVNVLNLQVNNENLYQQDLTTRTQYFDELIKVFPEARRSPWFTESTYPGIRHVIALNLQSPSLSENFINGNRAADGNALCYLRIGYAANPLTSNAGVSQLLTAPLAPNTVPGPGIQFVCWAIHDRVLQVDMSSGATYVQY